MSDSVERILVIKPSALGDIVQGLPALSALHDSFPQAQISWLVSPEFAPLIQGHPYLSEIIDFPRREIAKAWWDVNGRRALWGLKCDLRARRFDLTFDFQGLLRSALAGWVTKAKYRFGPANGREGAPWFYNKRVFPDATSMHVVDHYLAMVREAGGLVKQPRFVFPQSQVADKQVMAILNERGIQTGQYAVFVASSAHSDKCWSVERFAMLADRIYGRYGIPTLLSGTRDERSTAERIRSLARTDIYNVAGETNLPGLTALLRESALVVSNDTGPGHIAAGLGVPIVMLFSWSNPARIYPYGRPECMVAIEPFERGEGIRSKDPRHNVSNITLDEVWGKVQEQVTLPVLNEKSA